VYFGKRLDKLSIAETAMLAGLPQNPHYANPIANLERATQRQRIVLARMRVTGVITPAQQAAARAEKLRCARPARACCTPATWPRWRAAVVVERYGNGLQQGMRVTTSRCARPTSGGAWLRFGAACWRMTAAALARPGGRGDPARGQRRRPTPRPPPHWR
jgi:membrane carboxypeptidase/penicillin-binding protein